MLIPTIDVCFYWFAQISEIDNRLVHGQDCGRSLALVFHFGNSATVPVFVRFPSAFSVCVFHNQLGYLTFKTTKIKDIKLTLAVIPF